LDEHNDSPDDSDEQQLESENIMRNDATDLGGITPSARPGKRPEYRRDYYGNLDQILDEISRSVLALKDNNDVKSIFSELPATLPIAENAELKVTYKERKRVGGKLEYKITWPSKRQTL